MKDLKTVMHFIIALLVVVAMAIVMVIFIQDNSHNLHQASCGSRTTIITDNKNGKRTVIQKSGCDAK